MGKGGHLEAPRHGAGKQPGKWQRSGQIRTAAPHSPLWSAWDRGAVEEFEGGTASGARSGKYAEAGRLRRKVAAGLFFKVFDPGGTRVSAAAAAAMAAATAATATAAGNNRQQRQWRLQQQHSVEVSAHS